MASLYRFVYSLVLYLYIPFELVRLKRRAQKAPAYNERWSERFALRFKAVEVEKPLIWVHTVSVGETIAAIPVVQALQNQYPQQQVLVTTMTPTGSERVQAAFGDSVVHCYAPYDLPDALMRFLNHYQPNLLLIMETELWPNTIAACAKRDIAIGLMNARLSAKSYAGYAKFARLTKAMLAKLGFIAAQFNADAERFKSLGASDKQLKVTGNIKFDIEVSPKIIELGHQLRAMMTGHFIWVAGSTHEGEEIQLLAAHKQLLERNPNAQLILVPRHPERFEQVARLIADSGLSYARRSKKEAPQQPVYLADTMGEMMIAYAAADCAFVGGSLIERGGHNMLEPAALSKPILIGPSYFNFASIGEALLEAKAAYQVDDSSALFKALQDLQDEQVRHDKGARALDVVEQNRGALDKLLDQIDGIISR